MSQGLQNPIGHVLLFAAVVLLFVGCGHVFVVVHGFSSLERFPLAVFDALDEFVEGNLPIAFFWHWHGSIGSDGRWYVIGYLSGQGIQTWLWCL